MNHPSKSSKNSFENLQNDNCQITPSQRFLRIFLVRHQRLFISCHQILESVPQKEQLNALGLKGMWQRKSTTSACWFLVQGTLFLGPAWPSKSWAERCATVKSANGDRQNHDNESWTISNFECLWNWDILWKQSLQHSFWFRFAFHLWWMAKENSCNAPSVEVHAFRLRQTDKARFADNPSQIHPDIERKDRSMKCTQAVPAKSCAITTSR